MEFELCLKKKKLMFINARNETIAWNILKQSGVQNKSKLLKLVEINDKKIS